MEADSGIDVAVYVALAEEFNTLIATLPDPTKIEEDTLLSLTYYHFILPSLSKTKAWHLIVVSGGTMGPPRAAAITTAVYT